jgi:5'-3' exonuclease
VLAVTAGGWPDRLLDVTRPLLLIDSASLYFRAYFGVPESAAIAPDGTPVNAVRGFLDMVSQLVRTRGPGRLVCALDESWRPAWRVALIDSYKKHRLAKDGGEEVPDPLSVQVPIILDLLAAFGITAIGAPDYEADDVIGTLATREPGPVEVATGDRDLFQLVDDARGVRVLYCGKGVAKLEVLDDAAITTKYGVSAAAYADFAALRGDPSDGLPGVPGVGDKTAARLIARYGDLDALIAALDDPAAGFAPGLRGKLDAARPYLAVAPEVVKVARNVPLGDLDTELPTAPRHPERFIELAEQWGLAGAAKRLVDAVSP